MYKIISNKIICIGDIIQDNPRKQMKPKKLWNSPLFSKIFIDFKVFTFESKYCLMKNLFYLHKHCTCQILQTKLGHIANET
jgi:hypothetical protein